MDIHIAAPQGPERGLTRQQVLDLLAKSGLQVEYEGEASGTPVFWEIGVDGQGILSCQERDGKVVHVSLANPSDRIMTRVCRAFEKLGWEMDVD